MDTLNRLKTLENLQKLKRKPKKRIERPQKDPLNPIEALEDSEFITRYRFHKATVYQVILPLIINSLSRPNNRGTPLPPVLELCAALRYFGDAPTQLTTGDLHEIAQNTVSVYVSRVSRALVEHLATFINFDQARHNMVKFHEIRGFPMVSGAIDCTHIPIRSPGGNSAESFRNRKGQFSLNVQAICGADMQFQDVLARWPGSAHDSRIFNCSSVKLRYENKEIPGLLLGDSGYPLLPFLMTPILHPTNPMEERYSRAQISTRNVIERAFGLWKRRFRRLAMVMETSLENTILIILALAILHNIAIRHRDIPYFPEVNDDQPDLEVQCNNGNQMNPGKRMRAAIMNRFFRR